MHLGKCKLSCVSCVLIMDLLPLLCFSAHLLLKSYHAPRLKLNCCLLQLQGLHVFSIVPYFVDFVDLLWWKILWTFFAEYLWGNLLSLKVALLSRPPSPDAVFVLTLCRSHDSQIQINTNTNTKTTQQLMKFPKFVILNLFWSKRQSLTMNHNMINQLH